MDSLVDAIVRSFEFIAVGTAVALLAVLLTRPSDTFGEVLASWAERLAVWLSGDPPRATLTKLVLLPGTIGLLYVIGTLVNVGAYWFMQPAHEEIIAKVQHETGSDELSWTMVTLPFVRRYDYDEYRESACKEACWRNAKPDAVKHVDDLVRQLRLTRAMVVSGLLLVAVGAVRVLGRKRRALAVACYILLGLTSYCAGVSGFQVMERRYHLLVEYGSKDCCRSCWDACKE